MARRPRLLSAAETKALQQAILDKIPAAKKQAITRPLLLKRMAPHLKRGRIPVSAANRHVFVLAKAKKLRISTRVGIWRGSPEDDVKPSTAGRGSLRYPNRRIRRVIGFVCTRCFRAFPSKGAAKEHVISHPL